MTDTAPLISSLSWMMIERTRAALFEKDYENALEYALTVASVDGHPEVTKALAVVILYIIDDLKLSPGALATKVQLFQEISRTDIDNDYDAIRQCFTQDAMLHILNIVRMQVNWTPKRNRHDRVSEHIIKNIHMVLRGERPKPLPRSSEGLFAPSQSRRIGTGFRRISYRQRLRNLFSSIVSIIRINIYNIASIFRDALRKLFVAITGISIMIFVVIVEVLLDRINHIVPASGNIFSRGGCYTYFNVIYIILQFLFSFNGLLSLSLFLVLVELIRISGRVRIPEARELTIAIAIGLLLLVFIIVSNSKGVTDFARDAAKICHSGR